MSRPANRFIKGNAVYACRCCGRNTRQTGRGDNDGVRLCAECYELSGFENQLSDEGQLNDAEWHAIEGLIRSLQGYPNAEVDSWFSTFGAQLSAYHERTNPTDDPTTPPTGATMTTATRTPSQTPAAQRARARRAALKAQGEPTAPQLHALTGGVHMSGGSAREATEDAPSAAESAAPNQPPAGAGAFAALTAGLTTSSRDAGAALAASAAINKARKAPLKPTPGKKAPPKPVGAPAPLNPAEYRVGEYKGRAGTAMYAFIERVRTLGGCVNRERLLRSCAAAPVHALVKDRAAVLDYFAWAVRNGLLVEAKPAPAQRRRKSKPLNPLAGE